MLFSIIVIISKGKKKDILDLRVIVGANFYTMTATLTTDKQSFFLIFHSVHHVEQNYTTACPD